MTMRRSTRATKLTVLMGAAMSLALSSPIAGWATGYGDGHHSSGYSKSHHGGGGYGHGDAHHGMKRSGGHGMGGGAHASGHGPHQSASAFIEHILKFKEGMAITDDQVAKLQDIKTDFEKRKIQMKADMQLASLDLHEMLRDDKGGLDAVESKLRSLYDIRAGLYIASVKAQRDARSVLTDEQRSRMKAVHDRINSYKEGGMTKGHHGDGYSRQSQDKDS